MALSKKDFLHAARENQAELTNPATRALQSVALLDVSTAGVIHFATRKAQALLEKYCAPSPGDRLPQGLQNWLRNAQGREPASAWTLQHGNAYLIVRATSHCGGAVQLLLGEKQDTSITDQFQPLGLTAREAEVLLWIMRGKTNQEIGTILGCQARTIAKHAERIFAKLGVSTRTAAAILALEAGVRDAGDWRRSLGCQTGRHQFLSDVLWHLAGVGTRTAGTEPAGGREAEILRMQSIPRLHIFDFATGDSTGFVLSHTPYESPHSPSHVRTERVSLRR